MAISGVPRNTAFTLYLPLVTTGSTAWKATPTIAAGDFKVSVDGGATFANPATLPSETAASSKVVKVPLTAAEMNAAAVIVKAIDAAGAEWQDTGEVIYTRQATFQKNVARTNFMFQITDSTTHAPKPSAASIVVTRSLDGGAFAAGTLSAVTEVSGGWYRVDFGAGDLNGTVVCFRCTATAADDLNITIFPEQV